MNRIFVSVYQQVLEYLDDLVLVRLVRSRRGEPRIKVNFENL